MAWGYTGGWIDENNNLWMSGNSDYGQFGDGNGGQNNYSARITFSNVLKVVHGNYANAALTLDGELYMAGRSSNGEQGTGSTNDEYHWHKLFDDVVDVACTAYSFLALLSNGKVYTWGDNRYGQLGLGHGSDARTPELTNLHEIGQVQKVRGAYGTFWVLMDDGWWYTAGRNYYGELGRPDNIDTNNDNSTFERIYTKVINDSPIVEIQCGNYHVIAITEDGGMYACGYNHYGQSGHSWGINSNSHRYTFLESDHFTNLGKEIKHVACLAYTTLVLFEDGSVYGAGYSYHGQLHFDGEGGHSVYHLADGMVDISGNYYTAYFLKENGTPYASGYNSHGEIGYGSGNSEVRRLQESNTVNAKIIRLSNSPIPIIRFSVNIAKENATVPRNTEYGIETEINKRSNTNEIEKTYSPLKSSIGNDFYHSEYDIELIKWLSIEVNET